MEWNAISDAPDDGSIFIGLVLIGFTTEHFGSAPEPFFHVGLARWQDDRFRFQDARVPAPTHWQTFVPPA